MNAFLMRVLAVAAGGASLVLAADLGRGIELYNSRSYTEAERELREVLQNEPESARAHAYLGMALLSRDKVREAAEELRRAEELDATSPDVKIGLAQLYIEQKDYSKAETALDEAGDVAEARYYRGVLNVHRKRYEPAVKDLENEVARNPENAYAHYYLGLAYSNTRRPDRMVRHFDTFLKLAPDAPEAKKVQSFLRSAR